MTQSRGALIVQSDGSILLDVHDPEVEQARAMLAPFAHLEKAPEHLHTYRLTAVSLWNAASSGLGVAQVRAGLEAHARYPIPENVFSELEEQMGRWGRLVLEADPSDADRLIFSLNDSVLQAALPNYEALRGMLTPRAPDVVGGPGQQFVLDRSRRGELKQGLAKLGYPVLDRAGYTDGLPLQIALRAPVSLAGVPFALRDYQRAAVRAFAQGAGSATVKGAHYGGHGVVVLPCGAGKTLVGMGAMVEVGMQTLILATGTTAVRQWIAELLDKTNLEPEQVGEYSGERKEIRPVTVATYQIATRPRHRALFESASWGLVIYDEVHLLPAPLFRTTADLQAKRRLGLTATLVREDGRESEVFGLIGPKRYELPWRALEKDGWVADASCTELRVAAPDALLAKILIATGHNRYRIPAEYEGKDAVVEDLLQREAGERILVIGHYLDQLHRLAERLKLPLLSGATPQDERDALYAKFRAGRQPVLLVSRIANFSLDLPDASVLIQVSGLFGSRQEEAQRLGRILRPKQDGREARFYSIVTADTADQDFALKRQRFLTEQGYRYEIAHWRGATKERALG